MGELSGRWLIRNLMSFPKRSKRKSRFLLFLIRFIKKILTTVGHQSRIFVRYCWLQSWLVVVTNLVDHHILLWARHMVLNSVYSSNGPAN